MKELEAYTNPSHVFGSEGTCCGVLPELSARGRLKQQKVDLSFSKNVLMYIICLNNSVYNVVKCLLNRKFSEISYSNIYFC